MAARRMFSPRIVSSSKFLKLDPALQALYFHLGMYADDDGIVDAFNILRLTGFGEDLLFGLEQNGLIYILNDELISYIVDWHENNRIRADRKKDSMYMDLLDEYLKKTQDISMSADCQPNVNQMTTKCQPNDNQMSTKCQPNDNQMSTKCQPNVNQMSTKCPHRLGKVRLGKVSIDSSSNIDSINNIKGDPDTKPDPDHNTTMPSDRDVPSLDATNMSYYGENDPVSHQKNNTPYYQDLCQKYGQTLVDEKIAKSTRYHNVTIQAIAKWCEEDKRKPPNTAKKNTDYPRHEYDFETLEKQILAAQ